MHISDAKTFSPSKKKKRKRKNTAPGYIKGEHREREREREESKREFTVINVHLFTLATELISAFEW